MATTYTWKVTTLDHDRALETYLNKANTEEGWEVVFILPAERPARATVVVRKTLESTARIRVDASVNRTTPVVAEPAPEASVIQAEEEPRPPKPEQSGRRYGKAASKRRS